MVDPPEIIRGRGIDTRRGPAFFCTTKKMVDVLLTHRMVTVFYEARYPFRTKTGLVGTFCLEPLEPLANAIEEVVRQAESEREPAPPFGRNEYLEILFASMVPHVTGTPLTKPQWLSPAEFTAALGLTRTRRALPVE